MALSAPAVAAPCPVLPGRATFLLFLALLSSANALAAEPTAASSVAGARLYRQGVLPDGAALRGERAGGVTLTGAAVACFNCHRRSGLGTTEGQIIIPPVTGKYLFRTAEKNVKDLSLPHVTGYRAQRSPYNDQTLARAIREGLDADGRPLNYLMPRFRIDDAAMASLIAYLRALTSAPVPGVTDDTLHFATIITPDADPVARRGMLDVLERFFADKNEFQRGGARTIQPSATNTRAITYRVTRRWQLHVWELSGPPADWGRQLHARLEAEPVYAVISGLGGKTWEPVHRFCEQAALPCLFPNVDLPVDAEQDFYPVYFSKGVLLEAQLIAHDLQGRAPEARPARVIQIYRPDDIGTAAARALQNDPALHGFKIEARVLPTGSSAANVSAALRDLRPDDELVLWLRPADLAALPARLPPIARVLASGLLANLENAPLPAEWRPVTRLAYPFDPPNLRMVRMNYPLGWFKVRRIPVVAERVQSDTYLACGILAETLNEMLDSFVRDYLIERIEVMLSHRLITGYYPRQGLAPGQRFASKGGYLVRFAEPQGSKLVIDGEWIVP
jgi:hypothetical protein